MCLIQRLKWDSTFFGYEIGKVEINDLENFNYAAFFKEIKRFKLVYVFTVEAMKNSQMKLIDERVTFYQQIGCANTIFEKKSGLKISSFDIDKDSLEQLRELVLNSGIYSRFYTDVNFKNNEYHRLYIKWIENAISGKLAFDVIIASNKDRILGFTTLGEKDKNLADIGLVAVNKNCRGLGVGTDLINESIIRAKNLKYDEIQVVTQLRNKPAIRLYEKTNFTLKEITNVYHYWNL